MPLQKLLISLIQSPKGLIAITCLLGSVIGLLYMFVFSGGKKSRSTRRQDRSVTASKKSSPKKSISQRKTSSPANNKQSAKKSESAGKQNSASKPTASSNADKKSDKKNTQTKPLTNGTSTKKVSNPKQVAVPTNNKPGSSQGKSNKGDEGEWITVNKKKPRSSPAKKGSEDDAIKTPVTRSKTSRTSSAIGKTPKRN